MEAICNFMHLHRDKKYKYTEDLAMDDFSSFSHFHAIQEFIREMCASQNMPVYINYQTV
jgi:hypothetical protein